MKVLFINTVCGVGSTGRICTDIADMLSAQGHDCKIAYGRGVVPERYSNYAVRIGSDKSVKFNALKARLFDNEGFNAKAETLQFISWVRTYDPDVIHLHNLHGYYLNIEILFDYLKNCGKKIIWTLHDCWAFTGHCTHFQYPHCDKWQTECDKCGRKKDYPKAYFTHAQRNFNKKKQIFCGVDNLTLVTPSEWLARLVKESFLKEYPIKVIHNGIDLSVFKPTECDFREKFGLQDKKIILGVAGVWDKRKGLDDFLKLSESLKDNDEYRIVLVGLTDKQVKKMPKNIIGINRTNNTAELAGLYTTADVLFNPTYEDNYPTVNLEAQACGTPVITYATGGSVESVPEENVIPVGEYEKVINYRKIIFSFTDKSGMLESYLSLYL